MSHLLLVWYVKHQEGLTPVLLLLSPRNPAVVTPVAALAAAIAAASTAAAAPLVAAAASPAAAVMAPVAPVAAAAVATAARTKAAGSRAASHHSSPWDGSSACQRKKRRLKAQSLAQRSLDYQLRVLVPRILLCPRRITTICLRLMLQMGFQFLQPLQRKSGGGCSRKRETDCNLVGKVLRLATSWLNTGSTPTGLAALFYILLAKPRADLWSQYV